MNNYRRLNGLRVGGINLIVEKPLTRKNQLFAASFWAKNRLFPLLCYNL
jgi:hypothetical protein